MRTTVDIDDNVLAIARQQASNEDVSLGKALSLLALRGHQVGTQRPIDDGEFLISRVPVGRSPQRW